MICQVLARFGARQGWGCYLHQMIYFTMHCCHWGFPGKYLQNIWQVCSVQNRICKSMLDYLSSSSQRFTNIYERHFFGWCKDALCCKLLQSISSTWVDCCSRTSWKASDIWSVWPKSEGNHIHLVHARFLDIDSGAYLYYSLLYQHDSIEWCW